MPQASVSAPAHSPAAPLADEIDYLALLGEMHALREEAVRAVERLLAGPHSPAALTAARARVERRAAASARLLALFERAVALRGVARAREGVTRAG